MTAIDLRSAYVCPDCDEQVCVCAWYAAEPVSTPESPDNSYRADDPPLPWETAEQDAAYRACYALVDRATADGRDTVAALAWLRCSDAETPTLENTIGTLCSRLTESEWLAYRALLTREAEALVPVVAARHARNAVAWQEAA